MNFLPGNDNDGRGGGGGNNNNNNAAADIDVMEWYTRIPIVSRAYLTGAFLATTACAIDIVSPYTLYFDYNLIVHQGQLWRVVTSFLFFGLFSVDFLFHMYFLVCRFVHFVVFLFQMS